MSTPELAHLELLARVDELVERISRWAETSTRWEPMNRCSALLRRLLSRLESLRIRLEAPLIVATFGGTGTGKSTLVNALVGRECTRSGRERPTTMRPVLIVHPETEVDALGLNLDDFDLVRCDSTILRDIAIIDCPDPDTSEDDAPGTNLQRLHKLLPHCDVLLYVSTQEKYRTARVTGELAQAATGCRLIFVQTRAELDVDIREDWRAQMDGEYEVPDIFLVDSLRAQSEQAAGQRPTGDFGRLQDLLTNELSASKRVQIRRANLVDLIHGALERCREHLHENIPEVHRLAAELEAQQQRLTATMAGQLGDQLLVNRNLWERRLLGAVTNIWGFSPFSSLLRFCNGLGNLIASMTLYRARNSAQMALIGALQGARWLKSRQSQIEAESQLERISSFGLDDDTLREAQIVIQGYAKSAKMDAGLADFSNLDRLRHEAAQMEDRIVGDASRRVDELIQTLAEKNSGLLVRARYELLFLAYLGFVLYRVGRNFFYDSFWLEEPYLTTDFYVSAAVFLVIWSATLYMFFSLRLRRGLKRNIHALAEELAHHRLARGLFPTLEEECRTAESCRERLEVLAESTSQLRHEIAVSSGLGAPIPGGTKPARAAVVAE